MKAKISYKPLVCREECREEKRVSSLLPAAWALFVLLIALSRAIPDSVYFEFSFYRADSYAIASILAAAAFFLVWGFFECYYFLTGCIGCRKDIRKSNSAESKIRWFGCI